MGQPGTARSTTRIGAVAIAILLVLPALPGGSAQTHGTTRLEEDSGTDSGPWTRNGTVLASAAGEEVADPCTPDHRANGVTNHVFGPIPTDLADGNTSFEVVNDPSLDTDPTFHRVTADGECENLGSGGAELGFLGVDENGTIPAGAEYVNIEHWAGAGEFTVRAPAPSETDDSDGSDRPSCSSDNPDVWFLGIVYDAAQRGDFQEDVRNFEYFENRLQQEYCYDDDHSTILAFDSGYTDAETGKTYRAGSEANLVDELADIRTQANAASDPIVFLFLASHGLATTGAASDCPASRTALSYSVLDGGGGEDGRLHDCELGDQLDAFDPDVRMGIFVDCSFCGGFSDSLTAASGTVPDGSTPTSSGVPGDDRVVVTGCAITTECFGGGPGGGGVLFGHLRAAMEDRACDGWTAPGFPAVQGVDAPVNDPAIHGQDGTCTLSEAFFGAVSNAYRTVDPIGIQQQFRIKYGFDTLAQDLAFTSTE